MQRPPTQQWSQPPCSPTQPCPPTQPWSQPPCSPTQPWPRRPHHVAFASDLARAPHQVALVTDMPANFNADLVKEEPSSPEPPLGLPPSAPAGSSHEPMWPSIVPRWVEPPRTTADEEQDLLKFVSDLTVRKSLHDAMVIQY